MALRVVVQNLLGCLVTHEQRDAVRTMYVVIMARHNATRHVRRHHAHSHSLCFHCGRETSLAVRPCVNGAPACDVARRGTTGTVNYHTTTLAVDENVDKQQNNEGTNERTKTNDEALWVVDRRHPAGSATSCEHKKCATTFQKAHLKNRGRCGATSAAEGLPVGSVVSETRTVSRQQQCCGHTGSGSDTMSQQLESPVQWCILVHKKCLAAMVTVTL